MLKAFSIQKNSFPINMIQGPLAGVSCAPFRELTWKYGKPAFSCTEMISCKTIIHQSRTSQDRFVSISPNEGPVCFQLSGTDPTELAEAIKRVTDYGANFIDLNCGCPVKKIRNRGAGSRLLTHPELLFKLITAMKSNTHLPISIKIRVENENEKFNETIAQVVEDAGIDFLVVHGRHWTEHYETPCRHDAIQFFVDRLNIPVIGNGDIACVNSLKNMLNTGCAGVMIGRAGVGQPWLIQKLITELQGEKFIGPTSTEIGNMFIQHIMQLSELLQSEKFAILQARKLGKYYARSLMNKMEFLNSLNHCLTLNDFILLVKIFF